MIFSADFALIESVTAGVFKNLNNGFPFSSLFCRSNFSKLCYNSWFKSLRVIHMALIKAANDSHRPDGQLAPSVGRWKQPQGSDTSRSCPHDVPVTLVPWMRLHVTPVNVGKTAPILVLNLIKLFHSTGFGLWRTVSLITALPRWRKPYAGLFWCWSSAPGEQGSSVNVTFLGPCKEWLV